MRDFGATYNPIIFYRKDMEQDFFIFNIRTDAPAHSKYSGFVDINYPKNFYVTADDGDTFDIITEQHHLKNIKSTTELVFDRPGVYQIKIIGKKKRPFGFDKIDVKNQPQKIIGISQWGTIKWNSMKNAFRTCVHLNMISATDKPNLSKVKDMTGMFEGCIFLQDPLNVIGT